MSMAFHFFSIRTLDPQSGQDELNRFCAGQRVVSVDRQFVAAGLDSHWSICVAVTADTASRGATQWASAYA
jgi:hypothetical protein